MIFKTSVSSLLTVSLFLLVYLGSSKISLADEESPYSFEAVYTADYFENIDGGLKEGSAYMDNFDVVFDIDAEKLWGISGGSFHLHVLHNNSTTFSDLVGDAQVVSNIDNTSVIRLYEMWWEQNTGSHSIKFGLYDLNSEFDSIEPAGLFMNSSHGIGADYAQSGENGPSIFPTTSLTFRYSYQFSDDFQIQAAILDGSSGDADDPRKNTIDLDSSDLLIAIEANYTINNTRLGIGSWNYTNESEHLDALRAENNSGIYGIIQHQFLSADKDDKSLTGWLRIGSADDDINQFDSYIGTGLVLSNFVQSRPDDSLGFAIAQARNGDKYRQLNVGADNSETVFELTYSAPVNEYITVQPDIQYIKNPGTDPSLDDSLVVGIRFELSLL